MWAMSSGPTPARARAARPAQPMAGDECRSRRVDTTSVSWASVPASGKTHRSRGTPAASAAATEHRIRPAPCSTMLLEFIRFVYGKPTMRLSGDGVATSAGE